MIVAVFADTVRKEAATITAVFPSPNYVMSILVQVPYPSFISCLHFFPFWLEIELLFHNNVKYFMQRVLEQRVTAILDKLLVKPSLVNLPPMEEGGLLLVSRITNVKLHAFMQM